MTTEHILQTLDHKKAVGENMAHFISELTKRAVVHDFSKFSEKEAPYFDRVISRLRNTTYGSPEYKTLLEELKPALENHYASNSHHPEHYENGVQDMDLLDLIEMVADWMAAVKRHVDGDIYASLIHNSKRFNIPHALMCVIENTVRRFNNDNESERIFKPRSQTDNE
jgi:hypothetical protein